MIKETLLRLLDSAGYRISRKDAHLLSDEQAVVEKVQPFTMTSVERLLGIIDGVKYLTKNNIEGDFVECGVWRGGSMMAAAYTLLSLGDTSRHIYLYDTFEGLTPPGEEDVSFNGIPAQIMYDPSKARDSTHWCIASVEEVSKNLLSTGYPKERIHLIKGKVEQTIPANSPEAIALLRLDTDWYESTAHELHHFYSKVCPRGVIILDDYGHWEGARRAVDEFFAAQDIKPFFNRLDYTGRLLIKPN